ncbi:MAG: hypothetical protein CMJ76_00175 [Planctomycetaceae bacterium]|jgi:hypothetical protein|nr:hypothetical protein [Planctomycetaceae bacterium]|tara:strand:+ start:151 stop:387 length:237 start_codon:yes stop_codon:yes gene_type:complete
MSLSKEDEKYCEAMFDMFRTDGWQYLIQEFEDNKANINSVERTRDNDDLRFRKGQIDVITSVLKLRDRVEDLYDKKNL